MAKSLEDQKLEAEIAAFKATTRARTADAEVKELQAESLEYEIKELRHSNHAHRVYNFLGGVNEGTVIQASHVLNGWARESDDPITLVLNSPGGSVFAGFALIDTIQHIQSQGIHVTIIVRGMAASMGGVILQIGDTRVIGAHAHMLIHEVSSVASGKTSDMEDDLAFTKRLQKRLLELLSAKSSLTEAQIKRRWTKKDWWLDAEETIELGFADEIG